MAGRCDLRSCLVVAALGYAACTRGGFEPIPLRGSDLCSGIVCSHHGTCEATTGTARCNCESGFLPQGENCVAIPAQNPCAGIDCSGGGECGLSADSIALCKCDVGYRNKGVADCQPILTGSTCLADHECDDSDPCTEDTCSGGSCRYAAATAACDDDDPFTTNDVCSNGACNGVRQIYRSIGPQNTSALASGTNNEMVIFGMRALFRQPLSDNVGVGDVLQYDSNADGNVGALAFIVRRVSSTRFIVSDAAGGHPKPTAAPDRLWTVLRAYTSLAAAEQGSGMENTGVLSSLRPFETWTGGKDLVASGEQVRLACYADGADTTGVVVDGWVTGPKNYIKIFTPRLAGEVGASQRHRGKWSSTGYRLEPATTVKAIDVWEHYVWIDGLQIGSKSDGIYLADPPINPDTPNLIRISNNVVRYVGTPATSNSGIYDYSCGTQGLSIWNNIVYGFPSICIGGYNSTAAYYYNNTVAGCAFGFSGLEGKIVAVGNIASQCGDGFAGSLDPTSDFNLSDIVGDAPNATFSKGAATVSFVDAAGKDFHLSATDTGAADQSRDLSNDPNLPFQLDIDGETRPAGPKWDIGADERH